MQQTNVAPSAYRVNTTSPKTGYRGEVKSAAKSEVKSEIREPSREPASGITKETKADTSKTTSSANLPEKKFRAGATSVTIWSNKTLRSDGIEGEFMTFSLERNYLDKQNQWQTTHSLRTNDLPRAILALQKAYEYSVLSEQEIYKGGN